MHAPWPSHGAVLFSALIPGMPLKIHLKNEDTSADFGPLLRLGQRSCGGFHADHGLGGCRLADCGGFGVSGGLDVARNA
jgi:hypothetical protein